MLMAYMEMWSITTDFPSLSLLAITTLRTANLDHFEKNKITNKLIDYDFNKVC